MNRDARKMSLLALLLLPLVACTHSMQIKNLAEYRKSANAPQRLKIVLKDRTSDYQTLELFNSVHQALATHPAVRQVLLTWDEQAEGEAPDAVVSVGSRGQCEGSGWNYLITFPGFLLFTHAWNGYVYKANLTTEVEVSFPGEETSLRQDIPTRYNLRHCDFPRGAAASSGWYLPGWGGTNLIVGFFMVRYDDHATPEFVKEVGSAYGTYIANSIVELVATRQWTAGMNPVPVPLAASAREVARGSTFPCSGAPPVS